MNLTVEEIATLEELRDMNPAERIPSYENTKRGDRIADKVTSIVGSWRFLIIQTTLLVIWITLNIVAYIQHWDPYPFILLNLVLSFQAAYTAPIIMMSQNRQAAIDREMLAYYYKVNIKEELEIELLHHKLDKILYRLDIRQNE